jgi:cobalt-zinc-cadmium efflux system outer membrane protein
MAGETVRAQPISASSLPVEQPDPSNALSSESELTLAQLVQEVLARNPSLEAMVAAWRAAEQRYPQVTSLDDPSFMAMMAPASVNSPDVETAYALQASQKFPWFGKRAVRGARAQAEAQAAYHDLEESRLRIIEDTQTAFFGYYLVRRQLELNHQNVDVMQRFRSTAQAKYRANQVTQQDELQAEVELAELERQQVELERMDKVAAARINTLLRTDPASPLPPPPQRLAQPTAEPDVQVLEQAAERQRPDLAALAARLRAEEASLELACKDYHPDVEVFGRYDTFWQPAETQGDLRGQVGATVNVPIYRGRLNAAVREARFRISQRQAEYEQRRLDVQLQVAEAHARLEESRRTLAIYSERLIPVSQRNIDAATANYNTSKISFLELATAERQAIDLRRKQQEALAAYHMRLAELTRVVGGPLSP